MAKKFFVASMLDSATPHQAAYPKHNLRNMKNQLFARKNNSICILYRYTAVF